MCSYTPTAFSKNLNSELFHLSGDIIKDDDIMDANISLMNVSFPRWESSVVSFPIKYRPPFGRQAENKIIESLTFSVTWDALRVMKDMVHVETLVSTASTGISINVSIELYLLS